MTPEWNDFNAKERDSGSFNLALLYLSRIYDK